jgi:flavin-dependent dehydrogenase
MTGRWYASIGTKSDYDTVVVGARPAGAATAMLLARAGQQVLLVDRSAYGSDTLSTHALLRGAVIQLHRWGLLDAIRDSGAPAIRRTKFRYGDDVVEIRLREQHGVDALYAPRRTVLDALLVDAARGAGVEVVHGVRVEHLRRDDDSRVVGIVARTGADAVAEAGAALVVGADGVGSTVARLVGATATWHRRDASALIYGYFPGLQADTYDWCFRPGATAAVAPTNGGVANVSVGLPPARFAATARADGVEPVFRAVLGEVAPDLAEALGGVPPVGRFRSFPGRPGHLRRAHGPGWALVGDAGFYKDPITAHGITDALRDAELLVRSLLRTGDAAAYEATRNLLARPLLDVSTALASYEWDLRDVAALHQRLKAATDEEVALLAALDPIGAAAA